MRKYLLLIPLLLVGCSQPKPPAPTFTPDSLNSWYMKTLPIAMNWAQEKHPDWGVPNRGYVGEVGEYVFTFQTPPDEAKREGIRACTVVNMIVDRVNQPATTEWVAFEKRVKARCAI
jgi:hypothetical protein